MKKELYLSPALVTFEDLSDLLETMDEYIEFHQKSIAKYEDHLGGLLRANGGTQGMMGLDTESSSGSLEKPSDSQSRTEKRKRASAEGSERGWLVLESEETNLKIATGSSTSTNGKQVEALFKIIEPLKARLVSLKRLRKLISDLPAQGFQPNQKIVVMFRDGIPRQVIPSNDTSESQEKFSFSQRFEIQVLA